MQLDLDEQDSSLLRDVLDRAWRDAKYEIADTDNHSFKKQLKERNERLKTILDQLGGPLPDHQ